MNIESYLRDIFSSCGIMVDSISLQRWEPIDDEIIPVPIDIKTIAFEFLDGKYHFALSKVVLSRENKPSIEIPWLCIEISNVSGKWSEPTLYADEESIEEDETEKQHLFARLEMMKAKLMPALDLVTLFAKFAQNARELFS